MIAVDTNVLVHAHRADSPFHAKAVAVVRFLAEGAAPWAIPWSCVHEFFAKVTHPRIFAKPSEPEQALHQIACWQESPTLTMLAESTDHFTRLSTLVRAARVTGPMVHDARIAAICMAHGVSVLLTADRDFGRFPGLVARNPLVT